MSPVDEKPEALRHRLATAVSGHHDAEFRISDQNGAVIYATPDSDLGGFSRLPPSANKIDIGSVKVWRAQGRTYRGAVIEIVPNDVYDNIPLTVYVAQGIYFHLH